MKTVLMIEAQMKQYRLPFYEKLYERLRAEGIRLRVAYSDPAGQEVQKCDNCGLPSEYGLKVKGRWLVKERILYQPLLQEITSADLVISDHAYKLALTHYLLLLSRLRLKRFAFWGHGENRQGSASGLLEQWKKGTLNWVMWWFAYTAGTAEYLQRHGVPKSKITAVQNSVDTSGIRNYLRSLGAESRTKLRVAMGIPPGAVVGIFIGALQKAKCIPFLLHASKRIRENTQKFHLVVVGGGPEEEAIREWVRKQPWVHFLGPKFGAEKSELLAIADIFLLPGAVGLAILDAFAAGLPLVTTQLPFHGPEMEYLEGGYNGVLTPYDTEIYAQAVTQLFANPAKLCALREGARQSAEKYSIESMVENFTGGIVKCLGDPKTPTIGGKKKDSPVSFPEKTEQVALRLRSTASGNHAGERPPADPREAISMRPAQPRVLMTTSWDDGHPLDFRVAELLEKHGLAGTFYVPRRSQRAVMHPQRVRELGRTFEIGAHTLEHVRIDRLADEAASAQLSGSRQWVEEITGKGCKVFCFPGGRFKKRQLRLVREAGFRAARTVELLSIAEPRQIDGLCVIPTTIQAFPHGTCAYVKNALLRFSRASYFALLSASKSGDWVAQATEMLSRTIERGGVFHLWGHSWEIEQEGQWQQLESFLSLATTRLSSLRCVTNSELCEYAG
jgi:glycosyltransferase involved in cell wall biosynthesis/peptidoglycan/xylan/chitin deacetylase (PgdA/CDA1 family)